MMLPEWRSGKTFGAGVAAVCGAYGEAKGDIAKGATGVPLGDSATGARAAADLVVDPPVAA